ncbi:MAG: hypothetical protein EOS12_32465 [Mesorhizobium sp.]|uniref:hypothetical protein n=1 Tax=Mesorhizobium sp. TaxID=1871066 RepID=UPI000FE54F2A|nr:hypothetical protein [Mesorhizobium sp.]RWN25080.1 MAG: hypothetical protein EOR97_32530 [Mesorhizobium sp.]RWN46866.1 MAG: hypothetical protein EOS03_16550 [Mesorhizobium sp.]RWO37321.1 MAG: hypothetical protein EOS12_32465 [Mesorhizobium sp.]
MDINAVPHRTRLLALRPYVTAAPRFGFNLKDYGVLFAEKIGLFVRAQRSPRSFSGLRILACRYYDRVSFDKLGGFFNQNLAAEIESLSAPQSAAGERRGPAFQLATVLAGTSK